MKEIRRVRLKTKNQRYLDLVDIKMITIHNLWDNKKNKRLYIQVLVNKWIEMKIHICVRQ
jgi:hypothetical protein